LVLVVVTLGGALPVYAHVARSSPNGLGSIGMLERLVGGWTGKTMVLALLGFTATDFVITMTLSAADATEHMLHNSFWEKMPEFVRDWTEDQQRLRVTLVLLVMLGASFLRGFKEVIGLAVVIVACYLTLNLLVIGSGLVYLLAHPSHFVDWYDNLMAGNWYIESGHWDAQAGWLTIFAVSALYFPKLALGLSGFETGVAVMPWVKGDSTDTHDQPSGRIRNTRYLLATAAVLMSLLLVGSSLVTTMLIPPGELTQGGSAANRALVYLAHADGPNQINPLFGEVFGSIYDLSTVVILSF